MTDDEFRALSYSGRALDDALWEIEEDHRIEDVPTETVLLHRAFPSYTETMWIRGYINARMIVITCPEVTVFDGPSAGASMPGVIRDIPVGRQDARTIATFREKFFRTVAAYEGQGWVRKDSDVRTGGLDA